MRNIYLSLSLTILFIIGALFVSMPPSKKLRRGKDLAGGVSLVYSVQISAGENADDVLSRTIDALKKRVNPDGLMDISMVAQGRDRIEISMPLPSDRVKSLRKAFEDELAKLGRASISDSRIEQAMRAGPDRDTQIDELSAGNSNRLSLLRAAAAAYDLATAKQAAFAAAPDGPAKDTLLNEAGAAAKAYDDAKAKVLSTAVSAEDIRRVAIASKKPRYIRDGSNTTQLPSPREVSLKQLLADHPESQDEINRLIGLYDQYAAQRTTLDDPQDLMRMLRGAGVLTFRISVNPGFADETRLRAELREVGPKNVKSTEVRWYRINSIEGWVNSKQDIDFLQAQPVEFFRARGYIVEPFGGDYYMLCYDTRTARLTPAEGEWEVSKAYRGTDNIGRAAIDFEMNAGGGALLGQLTGSHVGEHMAVLLDDEVYTAPTLQSQISNRGQITGEFSDEEIRYIVRVLAGGSLQAKLFPEPISISSFGPELGADNLQKGLRSGVISLVIVGGFMIVYYFGFGVVAVIALFINSILILGCMAISKAAFTMPGIAGIILTFGMAVDSNVLIYERMREEFGRGHDMKTAVRLGFDKALASIVDGNVTNLIVCVVLYYTGTPEIRGFAITMGVGVLCTLFAALVASRIIFDILVNLGWRKGTMLPMRVPLVQHLITPHINWMRYRFVFLAISTLYVSLGLGMAIFRGPKMLDNEFLGGTQITLSFKTDPATGKPMEMDRPEVEQRVHDIGKDLPPTDDLHNLIDAEVYPINPEADGIRSSQFSIKTVASNAKAITDAVTDKFADKLDSKPPLTFEGSDSLKAAGAPVYPIEKPVLGANIEQGDAREDVRQYVGGVVIVLKDLSPAPTLDGLRQRLDSKREAASYSDTLARKRDVIVLKGDERAVKSAAVVVYDESASIFDNEIKWEDEVKNREWSLTQEALTQATTPASVHNFTAAIASTFRANAITAAILSFLFIGIYIWVRFKTPRNSLGAVLALIHDVITVLGLLALCGVLYEHPATAGIARSLGLLPFKIDLNLVAALLTIAGYSLNDTVVVMDRIRENKGKLPYATRDIINASINQTFSRTLITGGTTLVSCIVLYLFGGEGMRAFAFALTTGLIVGTYSSVAVAAPIIWSRKHDDIVREIVSQPATA